MNRILITLWILCCWFAVQLSAAEIISLNEGWTFYRGFQAPAFSHLKVNLPHTWNVADGMYGNTDYYRGLCTYSRKLLVPAAWENKRIFLRVGAAQTVADIFVNHHFVRQHRGGYTAFVTELTDFLKPGQESELEIRVNNAPTMEIAPICGDFNIFGGLYQGVELMVTDDICISPLYYGSSGVFFKQTQVSEAKAHLTVETWLSTKHKSLEGCELIVELYDKHHRQILRRKHLIKDHNKKVEIDVEIERPHLWQGVDDPYLYTGVVLLCNKGEVIDRREEAIGFRYFEVDSQRGFFLNGRSYPLRGVNRHQDRLERASAFYPQDHDEDLDLIQEMGCNAVRLCHYPQAKYTHQQMDRRGLVAWVEIPFVNVYVNNPAYDENLRLQLKELILQNYNHPCIMFWGLFNEINSGWLDRPSSMAAELHELAHTLDPYRLTSGASNQNDDFNGFTDLIAFNKYFGWYGDDMADMGRWIDAEHAAHPERKMGISEYGAGACVFQQADTLVHPEPWGQWHPENWQTHYHIENWKQLQNRPYLWCQFIWCMFDFSAAGRREGSVMGRNDKGLITYDRKIKKDAFYFYKANWNTNERFVHLAGKRMVNRKRTCITVQAFSNSGPAELWVNGRSYGIAKPNAVNLLEWEKVILKPGKNQVEVRNKHCHDQCVWQVSQPY